MGNAKSNAYWNPLSRFLPEEQSDIDGVFDTLSGSSGSAGAKHGKATKKTDWQHYRQDNLLFLIRLDYSVLNTIPEGN